MNENEPQISTLETLEITEPKSKKTPKKKLPPPPVAYKYSEDKTLAELSKYLASTYGQHYVGKTLQAFDVWESLGSHVSTHRDTAIKYLMRYGRKDGQNRKDLLKAVHYIFLLLHYNATEKQS